MSEYHVGSCIAKIEAGQIHELRRSLEQRICNFLKNYLTTSIICMSERTAFVVFLKKLKVWIVWIALFKPEVEIFMFHAHFYTRTFNRQASVRALAWVGRGVF